MKYYAKYIDHTLLAMDASSEQIKMLCEQAKKHQFYSVCVNSAYVPLAAKLLAGSNVKVCSVIGFPLGASLTSCKAFETKAAIEAGAQEIDMVINVGMLKDNNLKALEADIKAVFDAASNVPLKVIIETCLLTKDEIIKVCEICKKIGVAFVKTSTGFSQSGADADYVKLMKQTVGENIEVKASGGIRNVQAAKKIIEAGATRLGTSAGIAIVSNAKSNNGSY